MTTKVLLPERCRDCEHHAWYDFKDDPNHWLCVFLGWQGSRISDPDSVPEWCPLMSVNQRNCPHCGTPYSADTDEHGNRICGCDDETIARQVARIAELEAQLDAACGVLLDRGCDGVVHECAVLEARVKELEVMLKRLEYAGGAHATEDMCPLCCALLNRPHEPGCELAALLGDGAALRRKEA